MDEKINELIEYSKKGILSKEIVKNNKLNIKFTRISIAIYIEINFMKNFFKPF